MLDPKQFNDAFVSWSQSIQALIDPKGDYVLALKGNQSTLHDQSACFSKT